MAELELLEVLELLVKLDEDIDELEGTSELDRLEIGVTLEKLILDDALLLGTLGRLDSELLDELLLHAQGIEAQ